jgi:hypothetical protein
MAYVPLAVTQNAMNAKTNAPHFWVTTSAGVSRPWLESQKTMGSNTKIFFTQSPGLNKETHFIMGYSSDKLACARQSFSALAAKFHRKNIHHGVANLKARRMAQPRKMHDLQPKNWIL